MQETVVCTYIHFCRNKLRQLRSKCQNHRHRFLELADIHVRLVIVHQIFSLVRDWSKHVTWPNIPQLKLASGEYLRIYPNFQNCTRCVKDLKDNKHDSLHLGWKYARIFVLGHFLFLEAHSFPRAIRSRKTVRFWEQIMSANKYPSIFSRQMEAIAYFLSNRLSCGDWLRVTQGNMRGIHARGRYGRYV